jgi:hypothetical protein
METAAAYVAPHVKQYVIVDRRDESLFVPLRGARVEIVLVEDVVPWWIRRVPLAGRWWLSLKTRPIRNWMLQQIVKLSVAATIPADVLIFVDSDVFFVRPYDPVASVKDGKIPLFREYGEPLRMDFNTRWHEVGAELLGLPRQQEYLTSYVGNLITWRAQNVRLLQERITRIADRSWIERLSRLPAMSEYVLYGMFCEHVLRDDSGHYPESTISSLCYWNNERLDADGLESLRRELRPEHVAVMVSAKSRTSVDTIRRVFMGSPVA